MLCEALPDAGAKDGDEDACFDVVGADSGTIESTRPEYIVGWHDEADQAWRMEIREGAVSGTKQFTDVIFYHDDDKDEAEVKARWPDGFVNHVPGTTVAMHKERELAKNKKRKATHPDEYWEGNDHIVKVKSDRASRLVWLASQSARNKQICQLAVNCCRDVQHAMSIMIRVAEGMGPDTNPYTLRDEILESEGLPTRCKGPTVVSKKPSANPMTTDGNDAPATPPLGIVESPKTPKKRTRFFREAWRASVHGHAFQ